MKKMLTCLTVVALMSLPVRPAPAMEVALKVQDTAGVARVKDPCRSGIPLAPGAVKDVSILRVLDDKGAEVSAQFRLINRRLAGDVEWVSVAFLADVAANGTAVYRLADGGPAKAVGKPVKVDDTADAVTVVGGPLKLVVSKKAFAGLGEVWLDRDGDGQFAGDEKVSKGGALVIKGMDGRVYTSVSDLSSPLAVAIEENGPVHVVVRIDGEMKAQSAGGKGHTYPKWDGKENVSTPDGVKVDNKDGSLGFTVRLHVWKDQSWVRAFVTMRNLNGTTGDWTDAKVQFGEYYSQSAGQPGNFLVDAVNFDVDLEAAAPLKYRIGGGIDGTETHEGALAAKDDGAAVYQDSSAGWMWQAGTGKVWDDRLKKNIEFMKSQGKDLPYYEYGAYVFNELVRKRDGGSFMGYRFYKGVKELEPGSGSSFVGLEKEAGEGMRVPGWIEVDDGKTAVTMGCRWFWQMFPKSLEVRAPGKVTMGLWSQYYPRGHLFEGKIHKTHELVFDFRPSGKGLDGKDRFLAFTQRLVATPDARHNLASRAYGDFMLPNAEEWPNYEKSALTVAVHGVDPTANPGLSSSMEIEREKTDQYDVWKFGDSSKDNWHHFGQYLELDVPYCLMVQYARTGDLRLYRTAEECVRQLLDIPAHGGGYGHQKGEPSHYYAHGPLLFADVMAEPFLRDAALHSHKIVNPKPWHLRSFAITLWSNWSLYLGFETDRDFTKAGMQSALEWWSKAYNPTTHVIGGFDRNWQIFMLGMGGDALGRYCESFPEEKALREQLVAGYREWMEKWGKDTEEARKKQQDKTTANGFAYATRFSGDDVFLNYAAEHLVKDKDFPIRYRTGTCSAKNWSETMGSHRLIQVFLHDWDKKKHPDKYKDLP